MNASDTRTPNIMNRAPSPFDCTNSLIKHCVMPTNLFFLNKNSKTFQWIPYEDFTVYFIVVANVDTANLDTWSNMRATYLCVREPAETKWQPMWQLPA